jgi:hypothetical protein
VDDRLDERSDPPAPLAASSVAPRDRVGEPQRRFLVGPKMFIAQVGAGVEVGAPALQHESPDVRLLRVVDELRQACPTRRLRPSVAGVDPSAEAGPDEVRKDFSAPGIALVLEVHSPLTAQLEPSE